MKKVLFLLLLLVSIGMLVAVESAPSSVVGYFKRSIISGGWDAFSVPFGLPSYEINAVLGSQFADGDFIGDISGSDVFYCIADYNGLGNVGWIGTATDLLPGRAYWINRASTNPDLDYFLLGTVNPGTITYDVTGADGGGWSAFSLNEAREIDINTLQIAGALEGDFIGDISGSDVFYYVADTGAGLPGWVGTASTLVPTHAYWYNSIAPTGFQWTYTPGARSSISQAPIFGTSGKNNKERK